MHDRIVCLNNPVNRFDPIGLTSDPCDNGDDNCKKQAYKNFGKCNLKASAFQVACAKTCLVICIPAGYFGGGGYLACVGACLKGCGAASLGIRYICYVLLLNDLAKCK